MSRRALIDKRPILLASMAAALAFWVLRLSPIVPEMWLIPLKGAGVGLLALYAFVRCRDADARILGSMFVLAALGDMAIEIDRMVGAILFFGLPVPGTWMAADVTSGDVDSVAGDPVSIGNSCSPSRSSAAPTAARQSFCGKDKMPSPSPTPTCSATTACSSASRLTPTPRSSCEARRCP